MFRRLAIVVLAGLGLVALGGCTRGGNDILARGSEHFEFHAYNFYHRFVNLHYDFDRFFLGMDERNPDNYP